MLKTITVILVSYFIGWGLKLSTLTFNVPSNNSSLDIATTKSQMSPDQISGHSQPVSPASSVGDLVTEQVTTPPSIEAPSLPSEQPVSMLSEESEWPALFDSLRYREDLAGIENYRLMLKLRQLPMDRQEQFIHSALQHPDNNNAFKSGFSLYYRIATSDPMKANQLLSELPTEHRRRLEMSFLEGFVKSAPKRAFDWITNSNIDHNLKVMSPEAWISDALTNAGQDPRYQPWALQQGLRIKDSDRSHMVVGNILENMFSQDFETTMSYLESEFQKTQDPTLLQRGIAVAARTDIDTTLKLISDRPELVDRNNVRSVASELVNQSREQDLDALYQSLDASQAKQALASQAVQSFLQDQPSKAIEWIGKIEGRIPKINTTLNALRFNGGETFNNLSAQMDFIEQSFRDDAQSRYDTMGASMGMWKRKNPEQVKEFISNMPEDEFGTKGKLMERFFPSKK